MHTRRSFAKRAYAESLELSPKGSGAGTQPTLIMPSRDRTLSLSRMTAGDGDG